MANLRIATMVGCLSLTASLAGAEYREVVLTSAGKIAGHVRVTGEVPTLPPQPVFKHPETCGPNITDERLLAGKDGALKNAVVTLQGINSGKAVPRNSAVKMDNAKCAFVPHVATASVRQMIEFHNSDPFLHDAHAMLGSDTLFNVAIPKGRTVRRPLAYPGLVHINCNVRHTWMQAYLYVAEHPYHTVTGEDGSYQLEDVPPGVYTLHVWHEILGSQDREVKVEAGKTVTVDFELSSTGAEPTD